ncbi:histidine phosphatase family protein [Marinitoga aeolica]|uniref:Histidine phosphatase family protein n=1 Tax=Marinitoga aeolica TaxID=2809031 RepID=A0ABY8PSI0_9BACT|nr:histidine phosphatase family protein [Marinitoga aeolica]WGS65578.1 histidine phosphatase family protein [Marinitoga aeolica]
MKIYLIRHGMTDWNLQRKWQGNVDVELNEIGIKQAENLKGRFKNEYYVKVYSSPLKRAHRTALPISENIKSQPIIIEDLKEAHVALWNGYNINDVKKKFPKEFELWSKDPWAFVNGVESLAEVQQRGVKALKKIISENEKDIVVVSHGLLLRTVICWVLNLPLNQHRNFMLDNASVTTLEYINGNIRLLNLNETWHLDLERIIHPKTVEEEL